MQAGLERISLVGTLRTEYRETDSQVQVPQEEMLSSR
jgi:hypothetical protein